MIRYAFAMFLLLLLGFAAEEVAHRSAMEPEKNVDAATEAAR